MSDLHLGRRLNGLPLIESQKDILAQIAQIVEDDGVGAILMAGDIYDRSLPSVEAVKLFDESLGTFSNLNVPLYIVSGNHDSVDRLSFGSEMFRHSNIYISRPYDGTVQKETIYDEFGEVNVYLLPFLSTVNVKAVHKDVEDVSNLTDAIEYVLHNANVDTTKRNILVGHQYVVSSAKDIERFGKRVGGSQYVYAKAFADRFDYTALGHIHRPMWVVEGKVRYCGSPLKYAIDECNNVNSVTIVDLKSKGDVSFKEVVLNPIRDVRRVKGNFKDIMSFKDNTQDYVEITLTDEDYIENAMLRLKAKYPNVLQLTFENSYTKTFKTFKTSAVDVESKSILNLFSEFYDSMYEVKLEENASYMEILKEVYEEFEVSCHNNR